MQYTHIVRLEFVLNTAIHYHPQLRTVLKLHITHTTTLVQTMWAKSGQNLAIIQLSETELTQNEDKKILLHRCNRIQCQTQTAVLN